VGIDNLSYREECPADIDSDSDIDQADLGILLADWGCGT